MQLSIALWIQNLAIAYIALWVSAPILAYGTSYRVFAAICFFVWLLIEIKQNKNTIRNTDKSVILAIFYLTYVSIMEISIGGTEGIGRYIQIYIMIFFLVVYQGRRPNLNSLIPVFWIILATMPLWNWISYNVLTSENPDAARILTRSSYEAEELSENGVGGYALVYGTLLMMPALLTMLRSGINKELLPALLQKRPLLACLIVLLNVILGSIFVLFSGYSIAVIVLLTIILSNIVFYKYNPMRISMIFIIMSIFVFNFHQITEFILNYLLNHVEISSFTLKIQDILASLSLDQGAGTVYDRQERYLRSVDIFLSNPIIGSLDFYTVGKHSSYLDNLAQWGLVGILFIYITLFLPVRYLKEGHDFGAACAMIFAIVLIFGLNNAFALSGLMLFIIFPIGLLQTVKTPLSVVR